MHKPSDLINIDHPILSEWDNRAILELREKEHYLYVLSVILSEGLQKDSSSNSYDYKIIYDLLCDDHPTFYSDAILQSVSSDLENFKKYWVQTDNFYVDKHDFLLSIFAQHLDRFFSMDHFDRLKNHRLKDRVHRPILAVLTLRIQNWLQQKNRHNPSQDIYSTLQ
jgi:hypothetical protein